MGTWELMKALTIQVDILNSQNENTMHKLTFCGKLGAVFCFLFDRKYVKKNKSEKSARPFDTDR